MLPVTISLYDLIHPRKAYNYCDKAKEELQRLSSERDKTNNTSHIKAMSMSQLLLLVSTCSMHGPFLSKQQLSSTIKESCGQSE
jgi:hypothetical protein